MPRSTTDNREDGQGNWCNPEARTVFDTNSPPNDSGSDEVLYLCKSKSAWAILLVSKPDHPLRKEKKAPTPSGQYHRAPQMRQALRHDPEAGFAGHRLRQLVCRAAELLLQNRPARRGHDGPRLGRPRAGGWTFTGYRNGSSEDALKGEREILHLRPRKVRDTVAPVAVAPRQGEEKLGGSPDQVRSTY